MFDKLKSAFTPSKKTLKENMEELFMTCTGSGKPPCIIYNDVYCAGGHFRIGQLMGDRRVLITVGDHPFQMKKYHGRIAQYLTDHKFYV